MDLTKRALGFLCRQYRLILKKNHLSNAIAVAGLSLALAGGSMPTGLAHADTYIDGSSLSFYTEKTTVNGNVTSGTLGVGIQLKAYGLEHKDDTEISIIRSGATLTLTGADPTDAQLADEFNYYLFNMGTLENRGTLNLGSTDVSYTSIFAGELTTVNGSITNLLSSVTFSESLTIVSGAYFNIETGADDTVTMTGLTLVDGATLEVNYGTLVFGADADTAATVDSNGTVGDVAGDTDATSTSYTIYDISGDVTTSHHATLEQEADTTLTISNTGSLTLEGSASFEGTVYNDGTFTVDSGSQTVSMSGDVYNYNDISVDSGVLDITGVDSFTMVDSESYNVSLSINNSGNLTASYSLFSTYTGSGDSTSATNSTGLYSTLTFTNTDGIDSTFPILTLDLTEFNIEGTYNAGETKTLLENYIYALGVGSYVLNTRSAYISVSGTVIGSSSSQVLKMRVC